MYRLLPLLGFVFLSACGVQLTETVDEQNARVKELLALGGAAGDTALKEAVIGEDASNGVDLAISEVSGVFEEEEEVQAEGVIRIYCDEEEKSADWCIDGFIKYRKNVELGCFESYCKAAPKKLEYASGVVETISGGVSLAQPDVRLALEFEDLQDIDLSLLTIDQIEEFGRIKLETNKGDMLLKMYPTKRPSSVRVFARLANGEYLNEIDIYRVVPDFLIQFGDGFTTQKDPELDFSFGDTQKDGLSNMRGTIAFAGLDLTTFFINLGLNYDLDEEYVVFGEVAKGLEILDDIANVRTDSDDSPIDSLQITKVTLDEVYKEYLKREIQEKE